MLLFTVHIFTSSLKNSEYRKTHTFKKIIFHQIIFTYLFGAMINLFVSYILVVRKDAYNLNYYTTVKHTEYHIC